MTKNAKQASNAKKWCMFLSGTEFKLIQIGRIRGEGYSCWGGGGQNEIYIGSQNIFMEKPAQIFNVTFAADWGYRRKATRNTHEKYIYKKEKFYNQPVTDRIKSLFSVRIFVQSTYVFYSKRTCKRNNILKFFNYP